MSFWPGVSVPEGPIAEHTHVGTLAGPDLGWLLPVAVVAVLMGMYVVGVLRWERSGRRWRRRRTWSWTAGVVALAAALAPPLATLGWHDAQAHMVQHLLLGMYAPLALVLGAPVVLLLGASGPTWRHRVARFLGARFVCVAAHPFVAVAVSTGGLYLLYLTPLLRLSQQEPLVHHVVSLHLVVAGGLLAWSVVAPDPAPRRPGMPVRLVALVVSAAAHAALAKVLYVRATELSSEGVASGAPTQAAAQLMYYGGDVAEVLLATALFAGWYRRRGHQHRRETFAHPAFTRRGGRRSRTRSGLRSDPVG